MRLIIQLVLITIIAFSIYGGIKSSEWQYPIAIITLAALGLIVSKVRSNNNSAKNSATATTSSGFIATTTSSSSDSGGCGSDGGGC